MHVRFAPRPTGWLFLAACGLLSGCSEAGPVTGPVRGRVTLAGEPLAGVTLFFRHAETMQGVTVHTGPDGTYEVRSHKDTGLPPGTYQVAVRPRNELNSDDEALRRTVERMKQADPWAMPPAPPTKVPALYHDPATSGLRIEVAAGDNPPFDFDLRPGR
jgi:hypothetical protein